MKAKLVVISLCSLLAIGSCDLSSFSETASTISTGLSETEIVNGLKEALFLGSKTAAFTLNDTTGQVNALGEVTGYLTNELIKITLPSDVQKACSTINLLSSNAVGKTLLAVAGVDLSHYRDAMIRGLNRGAENAAGLSVDVFKTAVTEMSFTAAQDILFGDDSTGATNYLESTTSGVLTTGFRPIIDNSLAVVNVHAFGKPYTVKAVYAEFAAKYNVVASTYRQLKISAASADPIASTRDRLALNTLQLAGITGIDSLTTDIVGYATTKALDGLFFMVGKQEKKIRKDPLAALSSAGEFVTDEISDLLEKVFTSSEADLQ